MHSVLRPAPDPVVMSETRPERSSSSSSSVSIQPAVHARKDAMTSAIAAHFSCTMRIQSQSKSGCEGQRWSEKSVDLIWLDVLHCITSLSRANWKSWWSGPSMSVVLASTGCHAELMMIFLTLSKITGHSSLMSWWMTMRMLTAPVHSPPPG